MKTQVDIRWERIITVWQKILEIGNFGERKKHYAVLL